MFKSWTPSWTCRVLATVTRFVCALMLVFLASVALTAPAAQAQTLAELDISSIDVFAVNNQSNPITRTLTVSAGWVDQIEFDIDAQNYGASHGRETRIVVIAPDGTSRIYRGDTSTTLADRCFPL